MTSIAMPCPACGKRKLKLSPALKQVTGSSPGTAAAEGSRRNERVRVVRFADGTRKTYRRYECTACPMRGWSADSRLGPAAPGATKTVLRDNWRNQ